MDPYLPALIVAGLGALGIGGALALIKTCYRRVEQGKALIVHKMKDAPQVTFTGSLVYPILHRAEEMDISVKAVKVKHEGKRGLLCKDNIRLDIEATFYVRVNRTAEDVLKVAQIVGCARAADPAALEVLFEAKFSEAMKSVARGVPFDALLASPQDFKDEVIRTIGTDLNGFALDDMAIDALEQTPLEALDANNILDAIGISEITRRTADRKIAANEERQRERLEIGRQNLVADEEMFRLEQEQAELQAQKELARAKALDQDETARVIAEARKAARDARGGGNGDA